MRKMDIIIPALNEEELIGRLIDSLTENTYKDKEIIVVDDGSVDRTVRVAKEKGATVLINNPGHRGPAFSRNRGARYAKGDILCFLDADILLDDKYFLEKCANVFDEKTVVIYPSYRTIQDTLIEKVVTKKEGVSSFPVLIKKEVFLEIGGFPEIGVGEDIIFTHKVKKFMKKKGLEEKIAYDAFFSGHGIHTVGEMYKQALWYGRTSPLFMKELKKEGRLFHSIKFYSRVLYFFSFLAVILIPVSRLFIPFSLPFIIANFYLILKSRRNKYNLGKSILFLIYGFAMLHGLILFVIGRNRVSGR
jgi:glycosyltransferase involved in cell wall biosynthesis